MVDDDEVVRRVVHRHPFGLFLIYIEAVAALAALVILTMLLRPEVLSGTPRNTDVIISIAIAAAIIMTLLVMLVATYVYRESRLLITNKHVVQVLQSGLFARKVSRLSMANVEDVTAQQNGIFAHLFNYGTLYVETAGEQKNFKFSTCPHPNAMAEEVLDAREAFISDINSAAVGHRRLDTQMPIR